jgi:superfamily I DNA/RNA helicase
MLKKDIDKLGMKYTKQFSIYDSSDIAALIKGTLKRKDMADRLERRAVQRTIS